jgi:hypothetical protein
MSLELQGVSLGEYYVDVKYRVEHWGESTVVHNDDVLVQFPRDQHFKPKFTASIKIDDCEADTFEEALDKLARWMSRMAQGIMERGKPLQDFSIMYDNVKTEKPTHVSMGIEVEQPDKWGFYESDDLQ